jgi:cellulose synthase/poly-beta-1,6-N-acetylglucosamine synthase-like glycosyltransferase
MNIFFWIGAFIVFYTYLGYGLLLFLLVKIKEHFFPAEKAQITDDLPEITLLIAAYNEESVIKDKMLNCKALKYPEGKLKFFWITDGSNDKTNDLLAAYPKVHVLYQPERQGKTSALNRGITFVETPIVTFTDANTMLNENAILEIGKAFADPKVGCVAGEKRIEQKDTSGATAGEGIYWKYESTLKALDDRLHSTIGAAGELFAIRTKLFEQMPADTLLDDFILSMKIAQKGYKIAYCKKAYAIENPSANMIEEEKRKIRISAGGLQSIYRLHALLNPFKYGVLSFQYVSHRVLRWSVTPIIFFLLFPLNILLIAFSNCPIFYSILFALQVIFYLAAAWGKRCAQKQIKNNLFYIPYYFLFMNISVLKGFRYLKNKKGSGIWEKAKRA